MALSDYAKAALAPATTPSLGSLSSYASASLNTAPTPDTANYATAFASAPAPVTPVKSDPFNPFPVAPQPSLSNILASTEPAKIPVTPQSYLTDIYGTPTSMGIQGGIVGDTLNAWTKAISQLQSVPKQTNLLSRSTSFVQAGLDAVSAFFQPVSTVFQEAATIPGFVGEIGNFVNDVFSGIGKVGGDTLQSMVQSAPLSQSQKDTLSPLAYQLGALGAQIVVGKAGADTFSTLKDTTHSFLSALAEDARIKELNANPAIQEAIAKQTQIPRNVSVTSETPNESSVSIKTPATKQAAYAKSQGYEPIVPDNQLPMIEAGSGSKSTLPTIQTEPKANTKLGDLTVAPVEAPVAPKTASTVVEATKTINTLSNPEIGDIELIKGDNRFGLSKIQQTHPEVLPVLSDAVQNAKIVDKLPHMTILEGETPKGTVRLIVDHQLGTPEGIVSKTFLNNAYFKTDVLRGGIEPPTSPSSEERSTAELPKQNTESIAEPALSVNEDKSSQSSTKVQKTGEITKTASDINATLIKQGFDALSPDEQSHYTPESYKEISDNLDSAMQENLDGVKKMATGEEPLSKKLYGQGQILFKTISQLAAKEGDADLLTQLAKSPLGKKLSLAGQTLGESGYVGSDGSIDTVKVLRGLNDTWDASLKEKGVNLEKEAVKTEIDMKQAAKSARSPKSKWAKLVDEVISCKS